MMERGVRSKRSMVLKRLSTDTGHLGESVREI